MEQNLPPKQPQRYGAGIKTIANGTPQTLYGMTFTNCGKGHAGPVRIDADGSVHRVPAPTDMLFLDGKKATEIKAGSLGPPIAVANEQAADRYRKSPPVEDVLERRRRAVDEAGKLWAQK